MYIQVAREAPAQERIGVVVRQAHGAAAGQKGDGQENDADASGIPHQKLSTVIWPGARRLCFRSPRSASAALASFSMSGLPQRRKCELCGLKVKPAAASSRPSRIAAGILPAREAGAASRLTKETYFSPCFRCNSKMSSL